MKDKDLQQYHIWLNKDTAREFDELCKGLGLDRTKCLRLLIMKAIAGKVEIV